MKIPNLAGVIERRLLISYAVNPELMAPLLPEGLRPQLINGKSVAGVCLIRMNSLRPAFIKPKIGWSGENAAYRIAVEYEDADNVTRTGVYVPQRFSNSYIPVLAGGRLFPGKQVKADFVVQETPQRLQVNFYSSFEDTKVNVNVEPTDIFSSNLFPDLESASAFYRDSPVAWSPSVADATKPEGLKLSTDAWKVTPGKITSLRSSWFDSFEPEDVKFDHVLIMRDIPVNWSEA